MVPSAPDRSAPSGRQQAARFAAAYGIWLLASIAGVGLAILWHSTLLLAFIQFRWYRWAFAAFSNGVIIALFLTWLILVIIAEDRLRRAAGRGWLALRVWLTRLIVLEAVIAGVGFLLYWAVRG